MFWNKKPQMQQVFAGEIMRIGFVHAYTKVQGYFAVVLDMPGQGLCIVRLVAHQMDHYEELALSKPGDSIRIEATPVTFSGTIGEVHAGPKHKVLGVKNFTMAEDARRP